MCSLLVGLVDRGAVDSPPMYSDKFLWCDCEVPGRDIVRGETGGRDPNENAGSLSAFEKVEVLLDGSLNSTALKGRLPVDLESEAGADEGNMGEGRLAGNVKSGNGRGPGEFSRGEGPSERPGIA